MYHVGKMPFNVFIGVRGVALPCVFPPGGTIQNTIYTTIKGIVCTIQNITELTREVSFQALIPVLNYCFEEVTN